MYDEPFRAAALEAMAAGASLSSVSRSLGVARSTLRHWRDDGIEPARSSGCPRCLDEPLSPSYPLLLGYYLGDGCLSPTRTTFVLRVSCDRTYPGIIRDVTSAILDCHPDSTVFHVPVPGAIVVQNTWKHWPCLFPQHGPGRKHERTLRLQDWQREIVTAAPAALVRGLMHSDGCRVDNWARRTVAGRPKRYDYPRWQFVNHSADIRAWCCEALDLLDVPWRASSWKTISVSTRAGVARLDELVGLKQ
jgi:hypothetical protein